MAPKPLLHTAIPPTKGELARRIAAQQKERQAQVQAMGKAMEEQRIQLNQTRQMLMAVVYRYGANVAGASLEVTWEDLRAQIGETLRIQDSEGGVRFTIVQPEPAPAAEPKEADIPFNDPPEPEAA